MSIGSARVVTPARTASIAPSRAEARISSSFRISYFACVKARIHCQKSKPFEIAAQRSEFEMGVHVHQSWQQSSLGKTLQRVPWMISTDRLQRTHFQNTRVFNHYGAMVQRG